MSTREQFHGQVVDTFTNERIIEAVEKAHILFHEGKPIEAKNLLDVVKGHDPLYPEGFGSINWDEKKFIVYFQKDHIEGEPHDL